MLVSVAEVERAPVESFITWLLETWAPVTAYQRYRSLQQFFKWLVDEKEIERSPMSNMRSPTIVEEPPVVPNGADLS